MPIHPPNGFILCVHFKPSLKSFLGGSENAKCTVQNPWTPPMKRRRPTANTYPMVAVCTFRFNLLTLTYGRHFLWFTGVITHLGCWENTWKACKSLAFGSWFTSFFRVLPTSHMGYHASKSTESVVYCLSKPCSYLCQLAFTILLVSGKWVHQWVQ